MLLTKSQQRYPHYQKLIYTIIMTSRKVSHYFDEHSITIVSGAPLAGILNTEQLAESPNGTSSSVPATYSSNTQRQSKHKYSQTSWSNGQESKHLPPRPVQ